MPKMKTKRAAAKRFKVTGSGKVKHGKASRRHLMSSKSTKRKRHLRADKFVDKTDHERFRRLLPYAGVH